MKVRITIRRQPWFERSRKWLFLFAILATLSFPLHAQVTTDCNHDDQTVRYWESVRMLPGHIARLEGNDLTLKCADKYEVRAITFHLTDNTTYVELKDGEIHKLKKMIVEDGGDGLYIVTYCTYCRSIYQITKVVR